MPDLTGAQSVLKLTSRTFYVPVMQLSGELHAAVMSAYLCLRAIDEIEDHPDLGRTVKERLLRQTSQVLQTEFEPSDIASVFHSQLALLPPVTTRLYEWLTLGPSTIAPRIWDCTASMADRMADWVRLGWHIETVADLDRYTFSVAGAVGLLLSDLWAWHDGVATMRPDAVAFGRGLQAVNILRNRDDDTARGIDFFPLGWDREDMFSYAVTHLLRADSYVESMPLCQPRIFCATSLGLAWMGLDAMKQGEPLTRASVMGLALHCRTHGTVPDHSGLFGSGRQEQVT